jgi:Fe-S cluster biogenesis protein NfuA
MKDECGSELREQILKIIDSDIRPSLNSDGGDVSFVSLDGSVLTLQLQGACACCPRASETLKCFVERIIHQKVSENIEVRSA